MGITNIKHIKSIVSIAMVRDGGSLRANYIADNGKEYSLFFKILATEDSSGDRLRTGYASPWIGLCIRYDGPDRWGSRFEDITPISWAEASLLLAEMRPFVASSDEFKVMSLERMEYVAGHSGQLPPDMEQKLIRAVPRDS